MNIIQVLKKELPLYLDCCHSGLTLHMDVIDMDYSRSETDLTTLLYLKKENLTHNEAWSILTLRLLMHSEAWTEFETYTTEDIKGWIILLEEHYKKTQFVPYSDTQIDNDNYFIERLKFPEKTNTIRFNGKTISSDTFDKIDPLTDTLHIVSRTKFNNLEAEFYIETENHFLLLNWFTTS